MPKFDCRLPLSGRFWHIIGAPFSTYSAGIASSSVYITIVSCVLKVFRNFTAEEKSLNREKNVLFSVHFCLDFSNYITRAISTRQITAC